MVISIIVPIYNTAKYLHRCIESVLAQTFVDWEMLLIDDGSTDDSAAICDEYAAKDERIRVFHKENGGVSSARNLGLDHAQGEWITFVDSDDYTYPCWLENYDIEHNAEFDLICQGFETDRKLFYEENKRPEYNYGTNYCGNIADLLLVLKKSNTIGFLWNKIFKNKIIKENSIRFRCELKHAEDCVFIFNYAEHCTKAISNKKIGYCYKVPDWDVKYVKDTNSSIHTAELLYASVNQICNENTNCELKRFYREELTSKYIIEFKSCRKNRRNCLKGLRNILKTDFSESQIFLPTKSVIYIDKTYLISKMVLSLHLKIKKQLTWT